MKYLFTLFVFFSVIVSVYGYEKNSYTESTKSIVKEIDKILNKNRSNNIKCNTTTLKSFAKTVIESIGNNSYKRLVDLLPTKYDFLVSIRERLLNHDDISISKVKRILDEFKSHPDSYDKMLLGLKENIIKSVANVSKKLKEFGLKRSDILSSKIIDIDTKDLNIKYGGLAAWDGTLSILLKINHEYYNLRIYDVNKFNNCWRFLPQRDNGIFFNKTY